MFRRQLSEQRKMGEQDTHSRNSGEDDGIRQPRKLLLVLVRSDSLVNVVKGRLGDLESTLKRLVVRMIGRGVSQDLAKYSISAWTCRSVLATHLVDEKRVSSDALHRLEEEVLKLEVLDAKALRNGKGRVSPPSLDDFRDNTHVKQAPQ